MHDVTIIKSNQIYPASNVVIPKGGSRTHGFGFRALRSWCHVVQGSHHAWKNINQTLTHSSHVETDTGQQRGQERQVDSVTSAIARGAIRDPSRSGEHPGQSVGAIGALLRPTGLVRGDVNSDIRAHGSARRALRTLRTVPSGNPGTPR